jgi:hypothetical protein
MTSALMFYKTSFFMLFFLSCILNTPSHEPTWLAELTIYTECQKKRRVHESLIYWRMLII